MYLIYEKAWTSVATGNLEAETVRQRKKDIQRLRMNTSLE